MVQGTERKLSRKERGAIAAVSVVALLLRLSRIEAREPWLDEACSALLSGGELSDLARIFTGESNPPLYYGFLFFWQRVAGDAPWALRLPSVAAGVALVPMVWLLARRLGAGPAARLAGAVLAAASPLLLFYSLEARAYLPLWALALGAVLALDVAVTRPGRTAPVVAAGVLTAAAMYTHYYGVFLLPLWALAWWATPAGRRLRPAVGAAATTLTWVPWAMGHLVGHVGHRGQAWLEQFTSSSGSMLWESASILALVPPYPIYLGELAAIPPVPVHAALTGLLIGGLAVAGAAGAIRGPGRARVGLVTLAVLLPVLGGLAVSLVRPIYLPGRYELMAHPPMIVLCALGLQRGLDALRGRSVRWAEPAALLLVLAAVVPAAAAWVSLPKPPHHHRELAARLADAPADEGAVSVGLHWATVEYPLRRLGDRRIHRSHPVEIAAAHPGWMDLAAYDEGQLRRQAAETLAALGAAPGLWVLVGLGPDGAIAQQRLTGTLWGTLRAAGWTPGPPEVFGRVGLVRFQSPGAPAVRR